MMDRKLCGVNDMAQVNLASLDRGEGMDGEEFFTELEKEERELHASAGEESRPVRSRSTMP